MQYGILSLLPTLVLFVMIILTKRVLLSLGVAGLLGAVLYCPQHFLSTWLSHLESNINSEFMGNLCVMMALFGIFIVMMERSNAAREFALWLSKYAKKRWQALLLTELLGIIIFIDDALNNVAVGTSMRRLTDHYLVPRTLLGYITISTSAPVCILVPISTWAVFNGGLMMENGVSRGDVVSTFAGTIPYMFYGWTTILVMTLMVLGVFPLLGSTRRQQKRAYQDHVIIAAEDSRSGEAVVAEVFSEADCAEKHDPFLFLVPLCVLIAGTLLFDNNVKVGCFLGLLASALMMRLRCKLAWAEILQCGMEGVISMVPLLTQLTLSTTVTSLNIALGMPDFILKTVTPILSGKFLPFAVFLCLGLYSSFGGGFWEMCILFMPVVMPLSLQLGVNPYLTAAAVVSAAAAGCSLYVCGDTEALVSSVIGTTPASQSAAVLPYTLVSCGLSALLFLLFGFLA